jgi:hypothetical protein
MFVAPDGCQIGARRYLSMLDGGVLFYVVFGIYLWYLSVCFLVADICQHVL